MSKPRKCKQPHVQLPREIVDTVLSALIHLSDDDPAYQWMCLRYITRLHKSQVEQRFRKFWLKHLSLTLYHGDFVLTYTARGGKSSADTKIRASLHAETVKFRPCDGWLTCQGQLDTLQDLILRSPVPPGDNHWRDNRLIVRFGEGVLSNGYVGGGILSDTIVPGLDVDGWAICFNWRLLFTQLLHEEVLMRRMKTSLLKAFVPTLTVTKPEKRHTAIHRFLQHEYQAQRRDLVAGYRANAAHNGPAMDVHWDAYAYAPTLDRSPHGTTYPDICSIARQEESMVFHAPGWRKWGIREVARLRADEEMRQHNMFPCERLLRPAGVAYLERFEKRWKCMLGTQWVGEEELERLLRERAK